MRSMLTRVIAIIGAVLGWAMLALQLWLLLRPMPADAGAWLEGVWRYLGYFTILSNIFAAVTLTLAAQGKAAPRRELAAVTAMILVGAVYSLLLRASWDPEGWQKLADFGLHDVMPLIVLLFWLLRPHGTLVGKDGFYALVLPAAYCAYLLLRGSFDGWYPYPFVDVNQLGMATVLRNCAGLAAVFAAVSFFLIWLDRKLP